jgi:hypothetical protein
MAGLVTDNVVSLTPQEFLDWANGLLHYAPTSGVRLPPPWQPGQHFALLGKTREGKTNFAIWLLANTRKFVLALDPKGGDETLAASGWQRVTGVPPKKALPREVDNARAEGRPVRLIVGLPDTRTQADDILNQQLMTDAIEYNRQAGGYALLADEHQILSDQRMFRLGPNLARMAISAARDGVSVVALMQYISWVEKAPARQATLFGVWRTRNRDLIKEIAVFTGRPWQEIAAAVDELPKYHVLVISDELRAPMLMVRPPKVA